MSDDMETGPDLPEEPLDETTAYAPLDEEPEEAGPPLSAAARTSACGAWPATSAARPS